MPASAMKKLEFAPVHDVPSSSKRRGRMRAVAWLLLVVLCAGMGFGASLIVDVGHWRTIPTIKARSVASDPRAPEQQRINGIVVSFQDAGETIAALHMLAASAPDPVAMQAQVALDHLRKMLR